MKSKKTLYIALLFLALGMIVTGLIVNGNISNIGQNVEEKRRMADYIYEEFHPRTTTKESGNTP